VPAVGGRPWKITFSSPKYFEFSAEIRVEQALVFPYFHPLTFEERVKSECRPQPSLEPFLTAFEKRKGFLTMARLAPYRILPATCLSFVAQLSARLLQKFYRRFCENPHEPLRDKQPVMEIHGLEQRRLLASIAYGYGNLDIVGDAGSSNTINVWKSGDQMVAQIGGQSKTVTASWVSRINVTGGSWTDNVTITGDIAAAAEIKGWGAMIISTVVQATIRFMPATATTPSSATAGTTTSTAKAGRIRSMAGWARTSSTPAKPRRPTTIP
jgi:hypothetical protein